MDCNFDLSNLIDSIGILVNAGLAIWIVKSIQNKLTNKRVLKDHFITELKEIRSNYSFFLDELYAGKIKPQTVVPWFKMMNIKVNGLMVLLYRKYNIDVYYLKGFQEVLPDIITNDSGFVSQFRANQNFVISSSLMISLIKFNQENNSLFNDLIIFINDCE